MLSNVSKTADILRGNTQMQDLWLEVEKETAGWHPGRPPAPGTVMGNLNFKNLNSSSQGILGRRAGPEGRLVQLNRREVVRVICPRRQR